MTPPLPARHLSTKLAPGKGRGLHLGQESQAAGPSVRAHLAPVEG